MAFVEVVVGSFGNAEVLDLREQEGGYLSLFKKTKTAALAHQK
jgi:hypothetical protein